MLLNLLTLLSNSPMINSKYIMSIACRPKLKLSKSKFEIHPFSLNSFKDILQTSSRCEGGVSDLRSLWQHMEARGSIMAMNVGAASVRTQVLTLHHGKVECWHEDKG
ncbi:hypothetical protein SO802_021664 [Lithocarpus litseifolius]|uniref:Uncharacterized protein n=1 Tax=Lithocarpus litseifolius TaxID=425828 RepID=A0AAW2CHM6_9ROSI